MSPLYVIVDADDDVVAAGGLPTGEHATNSKSVADAVLLFSGRKVKSLDALSSQLWEDGLDLLGSINGIIDTFQKLLI